jgi:hypothetical protein
MPTAYEKYAIALLPWLPIVNTSRRDVSVRQDAAVKSANRLQRQPRSDRGVIAIALSHAMHYACSRQPSKPFCKAIRA